MVVKHITTPSVQNGDEEGVLATTAGDVTFRFDEIVVTVPLGCLKQSKPTFTPPLPAELVRAIGHVGYGRLEKVYVFFATAFWQAKGCRGSNGFEFRFLSPS